MTINLTGFRRWGHLPSYDGVLDMNGCFRLLDTWLHDVYLSVSMLLWDDFVESASRICIA